MIGVIIKYSSFFANPIPKKPLDLIKNIPKSELLTTISKINTLLNPQGVISVNDSKETQVECIKAITDQDSTVNSSYYLPLAQRFSSYPKNYTLFTRTSCLYALNEIISSNEFLIETKEKYEVYERIGIFEYLLICNERILNFTEQYTLDDLKKNNVDFFEFFAFNSLSLNQYLYNENPLATFYRARYLFNTIESDDVLSEYFKAYTLENYGSDKIKDFYKFFVFNYIKSYDKKLKINYLILPKTEIIAITILDSFSNLIKHKKINHKDIGTLDFLDLKKNPLYKIDFKRNDELESYLILDTKLLLNKVYSLFFNDFWFDYLKEKTDYKRTDWGSFIGTKYFENIVVDIFENSLINNKLYFLKKTDELKLNYNKNGIIEVADIYISKKQKIFLAEIKSNYINIVDGYKSITNIESFKKLKLDEFYKKFGLEQLVDKTINDFHKYKHLLNDSSLNLNRKVHIYPAIIVNDNILALGTLNFVIRNRFEYLLKKKNISVKNSKQLIKPLLIINIEQLQEMEQSLSENEIDLFNFLDAYYTKISVKTGKYSSRYDVLTNISEFIRKKINSKKLFPERLRKYEWLDVDK